MSLLIVGCYNLTGIFLHLRRFHLAPRFCLQRAERVLQYRNDTPVFRPVRRLFAGENTFQRQYFQPQPANFDSHGTLPFGGKFVEPFIRIAMSNGSLPSPPSIGGLWPNGGI